MMFYSMHRNFSKQQRVSLRWLVSISSLIQSGCTSVIDNSCHKQASDTSECQPVALTSALPVPIGIAVDEVSVYCTIESGAVVRIPKNGGPPVVLASGPPLATEITTDALNVYWVTGGTVMKAPKSGGDSTTMFALDGGGAFRLAVDEANIYWVDVESDDGSIMKIPISMGEPISLAKGPLPSGIAVDETSVYWSDQLSGTIMSIPKTGGDATTLFPANPSGTFDVAVDATHVYWGSANAITKIPKNGGMPVTLTAEAKVPAIIAVDDANVYWADAEIADAIPATKIMKVSIDGGTPVLLASGQQEIGFIALDATSIYWTDAGAGTVMKVAK